MRVVDTNILVRFLARDDEEQFRLARALLERGGILVPTSVILETEWVLRKAYAKTTAQIIAKIESILGLPDVYAQDPDILSRALDLAKSGIDLADAIHLASTPKDGTFITFDRDLRQRAAALGIAAMAP
jgi:predicted nucleic acid-binding protein